MSRRVKRVSIRLVGAALMSCGLLAGPAAALATPTPAAPPAALPSSKAVPVAASSGPAQPTQPTQPTQQIGAAQSERDRLAAQVAALTASAAKLKQQTDQLELRAELAEQKVADAYARLQTATQAADTAHRELQAAQADAAEAQAQFTSLVHQIHMTGVETTIAAELVVAPNPAAVLARSDDQDFVIRASENLVQAMDRAMAEKSDAEATAEKAAADQARLTAVAEQAKADAYRAYAQARTAGQQMAGQLADIQRLLDAAEQHLADLDHQQAAYQAYLAAQQASAPTAAQQASVAAAARHTPQAVPLASSTGSWTAAIGQSVVNRALQYLGWPYSFAAGDASGPTYGVAVDADSAHDASVYGFDCSGLTLYAWSPYIRLDHFAATQYLQAGRVHPQVEELQPGDLVFWSADGTQAEIGHVALYIGGGDVIQAPHSGAFLEITPLADVESGYFGATRPMT